MKAFIAALFLFASANADDFRWQVGDGPTFNWSITESAPSAGRETAGTIPPLLPSPGSVVDPPAEPPATTTEPDVSRFVHRLLVNNYAGGGCVCIARGRYVTAKHIFSGLALQSVAIDGVQVAAMVRYLAGDIALIECGDLGHAAAGFTADAPQAGDSLVVYGTATGRALSATAVSPYPSDWRMQIADGQITQGDSGGGVFTADGRLIGVISSYFGTQASGTADQTRAYFAPLSAVAAFLPSAPAAIGPSPPSAPPGAGVRPKITIVSPATWDCEHCPGHRAQDWSGFDVTFSNSDDRELFPCTEWTDARGVVQRLYGKYSPRQVRWSWERTQ